MEFARDLAIIILAVESLVAIGIVILLGLKLLSLMNTVQSEVPTVIASINRTMNTVQGTTSFVSKTAVTPIIKVASIAAAATTFARVMMGMREPKRR
ncbi:MAG: hypothetical protein M0T85_03480 [Dehalococcoidales bacterium]|nr:hypothetical protein [Dehalococcoidales bacterium]